MLAAYRLTKKECLHCRKALTLNNNRDIRRKKYCSRSCRQRARFSAGEFDMQRLWGKCNTPEANAKKVHRGPDHPMWIEDRSKLKSRPRYEMTIWRKSIFERDGYTCTDCGQRGGRLQADHIKPYCTHPELRWDLSNGRTLCVDCHKKTPTYGSKARKLKKESESRNAAA